MRYFILTIVIILAAAAAPRAYSDSNDLETLNTRYNQYSPNDLNNPYNQYGVQNTVNNPYSLGNQLSSHKTNIPKIQEEHDWHISHVGPPKKAASIKVKKQSPEEAYLLELFDKSGQQKSFSLFFPLLIILSSLALAATVFIIIGIFRKKA